MDSLAIRIYSNAFSKLHIMHIRTEYSYSYSKSYSCIMNRNQINSNTYMDVKFALPISVRNYVAVDPIQCAICLTENYTIVCQIQ